MRNGLLIFVIFFLLGLLGLAIAAWVNPELSLSWSLGAFLAPTVAVLSLALFIRTAARFVGTYEVRKDQRRLQNLGNKARTDAENEEKRIEACFTAAEFFKDPGYFWLENEAEAITALRAVATRAYGMNEGEEFFVSGAVEMYRWLRVLLYEAREKFWDTDLGEVEFTEEIEGYFLKIVQDTNLAQRLACVLSKIIFN